VVSFDYPPAFAYIAFGLFVAFQLLLLTRLLVRVLRDIDEYRESRSRRWIHRLPGIRALWFSKSCWLRCRQTRRLRMTAFMGGKHHWPCSRGAQSINAATEAIWTTGTHVVAQARRAT